MEYKKKFIEKSKTLTLDNRDSVSLSKAPVWTPDHQCKTCVLCKVKWTTFNRRHHCRQCGNVVCHNCSNQTKTIPGQGKVRVCTKCFKKPVDMAVTNNIRVDSQLSESDSEEAIWLAALYDYNPENKEQKLPFKKGEKVMILQIDDSGWWLAELNGARGWVPATFFEDPTVSK